MRYFKIEPTPNHHYVYDDSSYVKVDIENNLIYFVNFSLNNKKFHKVDFNIFDEYWKRIPIISDRGIKSEFNYYKIKEELTRKQFFDIIKEARVIRELES